MNKCHLLIKNEEDELPIFGQLDDIITVQDSLESDVIFVVRLHTTARFVQHFNAYELHDISSTYLCFFSSCLKCHYLFSCVNIAGKTYVKSKYDLSGYT